MNEYTFSEMDVGMTASFQREITPEMESAFRAISGDINPLHWDDVFAREIGGGKFPGHVTFGMLTASLYSTMAGVYLPGKYSLIHSVEEIAFLKPVFVGDCLTVTGEVTERNEGLKLLRLKVRIRNQNDQLISRASMKVLVLK